MGIIVGYENEKREIATLRDMLKNSSEYRRRGIRIPRGLALYGEPGVGKTALARSFFDDDINFVELRAADCCEDEAHEAISEVFETARNNQPVVILLDELDKIAGSNPVFFMPSNDMVSKTLLQELDSLSEDDDILVVATCNDTNSLGKALLRPGRFDRLLFIDRPDEDTRAKILYEYFERLNIDRDIDIGYIARLTVGYTGAKLECLVNEAAILAMRKAEPKIDMNDVRIVMNRFAFGGSEGSPLSNRSGLHKIAIHEAGHALAAMLLAPDNIHGASILPQGESAGHVKFVCEDNEVTCVRDVENEIVILLAGRVAEHMMTDDFTIGACSDLARATNRLHFLVADCAAYGYEALPYVVNYGNMDDVVSEETKYRVNSIITEKMHEFDNRAYELISDNNRVFDNLVEALLDKQVLSRDELFEILEAYDGFRYIA